MSFAKALAFAVAVVLLMQFAHRALGEIAGLRQPRATDCIGAPDAPLRVVYLHGLDTYGPTWQEMKSRATLRAVARTAGARIALPRAPGRWTADLAGSRKAIDESARRCFGNSSAPYVLLGFSEGAYLVNEMYLECRPDRVAWFISAGGEGSVPKGALADASVCGRMVVIAGRHEPSYVVNRGFARRLQKRGGDVRFIEHDGVHELTFPTLLEALRQETR